MRNAVTDELLELFLSKRDSRTVHEIIDCDTHKAYFDVEREGTEMLPIDSIIRHVEHVLGHDCVTCYSACGPAKQSYHLICNCVVSRCMNKIVAGYLKDNCGFDCIDDGTVMDGRVVRLESDPNCEQVTLDQILTSLITYTVNVPEFNSQVLNFSDRLIEVEPIIYQAQAAEFPKALTDYLTEKFGDYKVQEANKGRVRIVPTKPYMCELCNRMHTKDGGWVSQSSSQFTFHCSRCHDDDKTATFKIHAKLSYHQKLLQHSEACPAFQADHRADEYLTCNPTDRLTCIKARMGSGKTQNLARILTVEQPQCSAVMVSVRRTLAFDYMKRYTSSNSLPFESYLDLTSRQLSIHQHPRLIIQVDSLGRLDVNDLGSSVSGKRTIEYLILDEIESLLNQVKSTNDTKIVQTLCELMTHAEHVVAMDGLLQDSTVRLLEDMMSSYGPRQQVCATRINFNKDMPAYDVKFVQATLRESKDNGGLTFLTESIMNLLQQEKRVACFISGRNIMESIRQYVQKALPGINVVTFSGKDNEMHKKGDEYVSHFAQKREIISNDIGKYLVDSDTRLFMYTSTITAGVDINVDHFDTFIHLINSNMSPIETAQAIFRVRRFKMHEGLIVYQHSKCDIKTQTLEQILSLGNTTEHAFFDGRCDWTIPQQVLAMLDARNSELMNKALPFIVQVLKQHNYNLSFAEMNKPTLEAVELWRPDMSGKIIELLGWTTDAEGRWQRAAEHWMPTSDETLQLGKKNNTAYLMTVHDPLFEEKNAWCEMVKDLGMSIESGIDVLPSDVIIYHHKETRGMYHKMIKAQVESGTVSRGVELLRHAHDKCTRAETITTLPVTIQRPNIDVQLKKVEAAVKEQGKTERTVARAGLQTRGAASIIPQIDRSVVLTIAKEVIDTARATDTTLVFSKDETFQSESATAVQAVLEAHKDELKATHVVGNFDSNKCHEIVYNLMNNAGHPIAKCLYPLLPRTLRPRAPKYASGECTRAP
ncbi:putative Origin of replication binding protein [Paratrimastix pyriformis]|uniref:Origin of replication binding protein n=1 Tax=Paratrimastix pyriformis TaxID=342808 RepID=A0ABQ8UJW4_9EUKA|nr:putative Origin of replication binding protein [Paratrimastix pyriformis]